MQIEPAFLDCTLDARAELRTGGLAAVLREEGRVDFLDVDAAVDRLNAHRQLDELARGRDWFGVRACLNVLHAAACSMSGSVMIGWFSNNLIPYSPNALHPGAPTCKA